MGKTSWKVKQKYNEKAYDRIYLSVPKGQKDMIQAHADKMGKSVNGYINDLIAEDMKNSQSDPK